MSEPTDPRIEFKPDPIARQSDLATLRAEEKAEHEKTRGQIKNGDLKTRVMIALVAAPGIAKAIPFALGYFGWSLW